MTPSLVGGGPETGTQGSDAGTGAFGCTGKYVPHIVRKVAVDVVMTRDDMKGLMAGLLVSSGPPTGRTPPARRPEANADSVVVRYAPEIARRHR